MNVFAAKHPQHFVKVNGEWVSDVLEHRDGCGKRDYSLAADILKKMLTHPCSSGTTSDEAPQNVFFRRHVGDNITFKFTPEEKQQYRKDVFPGPMAAQMGKKDITTIKENQYWITEKSDGLRVMLFGMRAPGFPVWYTVNSPGQSDVAGAQRRLMPLPLLPSCELEAAFQRAQRQQLTAVEVDLQGVAHIFDVVSLRLWQKADLQASDGMPPTQRLERLLGFSFAYCFDRTYEMYLCLEEFPFPTSESMSKASAELLPFNNLSFHVAVLVDGELLWSLKHQRHHYSIFDIVCVASLRGTTTEFSNFLDAPMSARFQAIRDHVVEPHHAYFAQYGIRPPTSMFLVAKRFYFLSELPSLAAMIVRNEEGHYVYHDPAVGRNLTDGLVFTPESPLLYSFRPGPAKFLLKWKWPDCLTVDFKVIPVDLHANPPRFELFFTARHRCQSVDLLYQAAGLATAPGRIVELPMASACVAECAFDRNKGAWVAIGIRTDKDHGNGLHAVSSVLENVLQGLSVAELVARLCGEGKDDPEEASCASSALAEAHFRVDRSRMTKELMLQVYFSIPGRKKGDAPSLMWVDYIALKECFGYGFSEFRAKGGNVALVSEISQHLPQGTLCVRARFHPAKGRWEVFSGTGVLENCSATALLLSLERAAAAEKRSLPAPTTSSTAPMSTSAERAGVFSDAGCPSPKRRKMPSRRQSAPVPSSGGAEACAEAQAANATVAQHYDLITAKSLQEDGERSAVRKFNNWVKAVLVAETVRQGDDVLDLCCGRGGDLGKWKRARIRSLVGVDISPQAIAVATQRYEQSCRSTYAGAFLCGDTFDGTLAQRLADFLPPSGTFSVVSCQFAVHYAFRSEAQ
eukprot:RCo014998